MLAVVFVSVGSYAATYSTWSSRGAQGVAYVKNSIWWTTDNAKITKHDTHQKVSGIMVAGLGIKKQNSLSNNNKFSFLCSMKTYSGIPLGSYTIGWENGIDDRCNVYKSGHAFWYYNV